MVEWRRWNIWIKLTTVAIFTALNIIIQKTSGLWKPTTKWEAKWAGKQGSNYLMKQTWSMNKMGWKWSLDTARHYYERKEQLLRKQQQQHEEYKCTRYDNSYWNDLRTTNEGLIEVYSLGTNITMIIWRQLKLNELTEELLDIFIN